MKVLTFDTLDSTNNYLKLHASTLPHLTVVRARYQTSGRGQMLRQWQSNPNENILVSFLFKTFQPTTTTALIERRTIEACQTFLSKFGIRGDHKLPNDILVNQQKIAGMLIETKQTGHTLDYVIVGIGVNINQQSFIGLSQATSLAILTKKTYEIDTIFHAFLNACSPFQSL